jgi:hypothetical protein
MTTKTGFGNMRMAGTILAALGGGAAALGGKALYDGMAGEAPPTMSDNGAGMRGLMAGVVSGEITPEAAAAAVGSGVTPRDIVTLAKRMLVEQAAAAAPQLAAPAPPQASVVVA